MSNTLYDALFAPHADNPNPFLMLPDGTDISYADFVQMAAQYAAALSNAGVSCGDRVIVQAEKSARALAIYAGCVQAGIIYVPINTAYTTAEVSYFLDNSGAVAMLCDPAKLDALQDIETDAQFFTQTPDGGGDIDTLAAQETQFQTIARGPDDLGAFLYTSGTTGRSKGAMLSHNNLLSNALTLRDILQFTDQDRLLHALPIFHTHGLFVATNICLLAGSAMILLPKFDVDAMIANMPRATSIMGVPTFFTRLLEDARFDRDSTAHMRLFVSGSAPMLYQTHIEFRERTGHQVLERYGMTETNMNTSNPFDGDRRPGTVGLAVDGVEVKVCDPQGSELPRGEVGVLEVRGPNVFQGYWQMPEKTAEDLRENGFFITGDLATMSDDGYVTIVGRDKDLIISGGYNVYPKELESLIDDQPGVLESAVIGVPHPDLGEVAHAVLVAGPGAALDVEQVSNAVAENLARFKHPRQYHIVDALPRNAMGKVQKNILRDQFH